MPSPIFNQGYRIDWKTMDDEQSLYLLIHDTTSGLNPTAEYYQLTGATANPISLAVIDNDESTFTPMRAKKCVIKILSDDIVRFGTFSSGADDRFLIEYFSGSQIYFTGFLVTEGNTQAFLPGRTVITLTATDNLKLLDKPPLTDENGDNPRGNYSLMDYIVMALRPTGLELNFHVVMSLMESGNGSSTQNATFVTSGNLIKVINSVANQRFFRPGKRIVVTGTASNNGEFTVVAVTTAITLNIQSSIPVTNEGPVSTTFNDKNPCLLNNMYVDAKTWEDKINVSQDCLTVLTNILKSVNCFIEQYKGEWWIVSYDDFRNDSAAHFYLNSDGTINTWGGGVSNWDKEIGLLDDSKPIRVANAATITGLKLRQKSAMRFYKYNTWQEILCNQNFERGDFIDTLSDETIDGVTYNVFSYEVDCWTYYKAVPPTTNDSIAYIKKYFVNGYEKARFIHMPHTAVNALYYLSSEKIPVSKDDKFTIGIDFKRESTPSTPYTLNVLWIRLYGDDGSHWNFRFDSGEGVTLAPEWALSNSNWTTNTRFARYLGSQDLTTWQSISFDLLPLPVSGLLEISLMNSDASNTSFKDYTNLQLEYIPFINLSYQKYTQEHDKFTGTDNSKNKTEQENFIWGGVRKLFKGSMKYYSGSDVTNENNYYLATDFYNWADGYLGGFEFDRFGKYVANQLWNQVRNEMSYFICSLKDLDMTTDNPADLTHRYFIIHQFETAINRTFMGVALPNQLHREQLWEMTLNEVYNTDNGYEYDSAKHEFKYE